MHEEEDPTKGKMIDCVIKDLKNHGANQEEVANKEVQIKIYFAILK